MTIKDGQLGLALSNTPSLGPSGMRLTVAGSSACDICERSRLQSAAMFR